jgi:FkbM family methyltransferase
MPGGVDFHRDFQHLQASGHGAARRILSLLHHPVLSCFTPFSGEVPADYHFDFLGTRIRHRFIAGFSQRWGARTVEYSCPTIDNEYFEWIDLLESVVAARGSYTMMELGAGFGRWAVRAAYAVEQYHPRLPYRLIAAEAEPLKFGWMRLHFGDNGIDPDRHSLMHAAVSDAPGTVPFYIGGPKGGPFDQDPGAWYGQSLTRDSDADDNFDEDGEYCGFPVRLHRKTGWRSICVPGVTLAGLLKGHDRVDLIDLDIEGQELPSIRSAIKKLNAKVKRLHIGTHGREIEAGLRDVLSRHGWRSVADYPVFSTSETPWGTITFQDGVQSWVNPRLP